MNITKVQESLRARGFDGWLLADFHGRNEIAVRAMGLSSHLTRRAFYFIPAQGEPTALAADCALWRCRRRFAPDCSAMCNRGPR